MNDIPTSFGVSLTGELLQNYFRNLVNQFFKILPMRENGEISLCTYMKSLQRELIGIKSLLPDIRDDSLYLTLLAILQYLIDNPDCNVKDVRREVFRAISVCEKIKSLYTEAEVHQ